MVGRTNAMELLCTQIQVISSAANPSINRMVSTSLSFYEERGGDLRPSVALALPSTQRYLPVGSIPLMQVKHLHRGRGRNRVSYQRQHLAQELRQVREAVHQDKVCCEREVHVHEVRV